MGSAWHRRLRRGKTGFGCRAACEEGSIHGDQRSAKRKRRGRRCGCKRAAEGDDAPPVRGGCFDGCSDDAASGGDAAGEVDYANWDAVLEAAKGQTVSWYGWGGSEPRNTWITTVLAPALKEKYDVTLNLVGMDINDILTKLSGEMQAGVEAGSIDYIWINGENFYSTK